MENAENFELLHRKWRRVTREWLAARNAMSWLQDAAVSDVRTACAIAQRLQSAEQQRAQLAREVENWLQRSATAR